MADTADDQWLYQLTTLTQHQKLDQVLETAGFKQLDEAASCNHCRGVQLLITDVWLHMAG